MTLAAPAGPRSPAAPVRFPRPVLLVGVFLAGTALLRPEARTLAALMAVIVLGVPHGALDGEIARAVLRPRLGRAWFAAFALPYLALIALVLAAWRASPLVTLALFLAASVWHFGSEEAGDADALETLVRGGLPVAVPVLAHPAATALLLGTVAGIPLVQPPAWLEAGALGWLVLALAWAIRTAVRRPPDLAVPAGLAILFAVLPPITAFSIYFVCVHAPAHTGALVRNPRRAPRVLDGRSAVLLALPLTGLTVLLGAALWPLYDGPAADRLLSLTIQGLAALTLPHMLFEAVLDRLGL